MFQRRLLTDSGVAELADGVVNVLEHVGILCQNDEILEALSAWGASIDTETQIARFPRELVKEFVTGLRAEGLAGSSDAGSQFVPPPLPTLETQVAQFFRDDATGELRPGNREDFITLIKLGDVLHPEEDVGHSLLLTDVPPMVEPLEAAMLLAEYAHRPGPAFAWNVRQVDYLTEMGDILGIPDWFTWGASCFAHPLRFDRDVADKFVRSVRSGRAAGLAGMHVTAAAGLTGMQISGFTTPVTAAGFIVVSAAEFVGTWIAARALNPAVPLTGSIWGGSLDMQTGGVSYSSPDAMLRAFAASEFLRKWCSLEVAVGGGEYCDAKAPGLYTALEKAYKAMTIAAFSGRHPSVGQGMLESGRTISPVQLLLDRELGRAVQILGQPIEVTPETIALDTIFDVGVALDKSYLHTTHTLKNFRENTWLPELIDRSGWNGAESDQALVAKARQKVEELIAAYVKPEVDPDKLARMREIVERARLELIT